jgi:hypothetical protein
LLLAVRFASGIRHILHMARKYSKKSQEKVAETMSEMKRGTLRSGKSGKRVKSRKQAVAIGLSKARKAGARVPNPRRQQSGRKNKQKKGT